MTAPSYVQINGTFEDGSGTPLSGTATFTPSSTVYDAGAPVMQPNTPIQAQIVGGALQAIGGGPLKLLATDNAGITVEGLTGYWYWTVQVTIGGVAQPSWSFFLPTTTAVDLYSLANTPAGGGGGGFANPMTQLGDLISGGSGGAAARLPGNPATTRKFLRSVGDGVSPGAPAWDPLQAADIPRVLSQVAPTVTALVDAATISVNAAVGNDFRVTLGGNRTMGAPSNPLDGQVITFLVTQPASGGPYTLTWASGAGGYSFGSGSAPALSSAANATDLFTFKYRSSDGKWLYTAQAGGSLQPWQFAPEAYGAKGDGKVIGDATIAGGTLTTLTSASAGFTAADTGKYIMINGGQGNNAQPLITTITYVNATTVTLASAASGAVTNASAVYGTDDSAAVQAAVTAAGNYALAPGGNYHAQVIFGNKLYCLAAPPPVTSGIAGSTTCQVRLPAPAASGATQKLIIDLIGVGAADDNMYFDAAVPGIQGSALVSMCIPPYVSGTNPRPSVVGYQYAVDGSLAGGFANTKCYVDGLTVVIPFLGPQGGYDFWWLGGAGGGTGSAKAFGAPSAGAYNNLSSLPTLPGQTGGSSFGIRMPQIGNNDDCTWKSFASEGFTFGAILSEHSEFQRLSCIYPVAGIVLTGGGAHGIRIGYATVEGNAYTALQCTDPSPIPVSIGILDCETVTTWHVQDTNNALRGSVLVHTNNASPPLVTGATGLLITWDGLGPGHWPGAPAVPGSGTAQQNTAWRAASVVVHTGAGVTVSAIDVDGVTTGLTLGASASLALPRVGGGKNVTLTYAGGAPTWDWWLD